MPRKALLGNWYEEEIAQNDRKKLTQCQHACDAVKQSANATAEVLRAQSKVQHNNTPYQISPAPLDGHLRFYTPIMLQNADTLSYLSLDLDDRQFGATGWQVGCSTAPANESTLRNSFVLIPAPSPSTNGVAFHEDEANVVHYGQPMYIMTVPELCENSLYLVSEFKSPSSASRLSGKYQYVYLSPDGANATAMWCADYADEQMKEDMRDRPVCVGDPLILRHNMTNGALISVKEERFCSDFGAEYEVGCGRLTMYASKRKAGPLLSANFWTPIHASHEKASN